MGIATPEIYNEMIDRAKAGGCLLYTSDAADE